MWHVWRKEKCTQGFDGEISKVRDRREYIGVACIMAVYWVLNGWGEKGQTELARCMAKWGRGGVGESERESF